MNLDGTVATNTTINRDLGADHYWGWWYSQHDGCMCPCLMLADLLQAYSAFIYKGSFWPHEPHPCLGSHFFQKCTVFLCTFGKNVNLKEGVVCGVRRWLMTLAAKTPPEAPENWPDDFPEFKAKAVAHTLYGVGGGGHLHGYGWINTFQNGNPRSEFPKDWTTQDVINAAFQILSRPDSQHDHRGYQGTYLGVTVRVGTEGGTINTVFPLKKGR